MQRDSLKLTPGSLLNTQIVYYISLNFKIRVTKKCYGAKVDQSVFNQI